MDLSDESYLRTGYEPNAYDFKETAVEPDTELMDSPPLLSDKGFPADAEYDDAALEGVLREAHRVHSHHSQREDLSVSLSSSSVSDRTGRPAEQNRHEFQAAYDRRSLLKLGEIVESHKKNFITLELKKFNKEINSASSRTIIAAKFEITSSSPEKSHRNGRVKEVSEFHLR